MLAVHSDLAGRPRLTILATSPLQLKETIDALADFCSSASLEISAAKAQVTDAVPPPHVEAELWGVHPRTALQRNATSQHKNTFSLCASCRESLLPVIYGNCPVLDWFHVFTAAMVAGFNQIMESSRSVHCWWQICIVV